MVGPYAILCFVASSRSMEATAHLSRLVSYLRLFYKLSVGFHRVRVSRFKALILLSPSKEGHESTWFNW